MPVEAREMKGGVVITILLIYRIAASVEQERRDFHVPLPAREEKRGVVTILLIDRIAASVEQERRDLQMPFPAFDFSAALTDRLR